MLAAEASAGEQEVRDRLGDETVVAVGGGGEMEAVQERVEEPGNSAGVQVIKGTGLPGGTGY